MITWLASIASLPCSPSSSSFHVVPPETKRPCPCSQVTLFFLNSPAMPPVILRTIWSLRASIALRSKLTPLAMTPCAWSLCRARS